MVVWIARIPTRHHRIKDFTPLLASSVKLTLSARAGNLIKRIRHCRCHPPIGKLPAADAGYRAAGDGGHGHFGKAVVVDGELNGRRGDFGDETASRVEYVMAYPFLLAVVGAMLISGVWSDLKKRRILLVDHQNDHNQQ